MQRVSDIPSCGMIHFQVVTTMSLNLTQAKPGSPQEEPLLLTVEGVSRLLGISVRSVWRLTSAGELPGPITLGRSKRWARRTIEEYVAGKTAQRNALSR